MPDKELKRRILEMGFVKPTLNYGEISTILFNEGVLTSDNPKKVRDYIEEAVIWLLAEQKRLEDLERRHSIERQLEHDLCVEFGLREARVVPGGDPTADGYAPLHAHTKAAVAYFEEVVGQADRQEQKLYVAVSGGETILDMVSSLPDRTRPGVAFYSAALIGRSKASYAVAHVSPDTNSTIAWSRSGKLVSRLRYATVPPYEVEKDPDMDEDQLHTFASQEISRQLHQHAEEEYVRTFLKEMYERVNFAIAGVGLLKQTDLDSETNPDYTSRISMNFLLDKHGVDLNGIAKKGCIGDINYAMFDHKGIGHEDWQFFITAGHGSPHPGPAFYRWMVDRGLKVMVIAGARKEKVVRVAMRAKLLNVLITDAYTARRLLLDPKG